MCKIKFLVDFYIVIVCWPRLFCRQASTTTKPSMRACARLTQRWKLTCDQILKIKPPHYCPGSLNKQEAFIPAGPSGPIDQPITQWVAPEETCESILHKAQSQLLDPYSLFFGPVFFLSKVGMLLLLPCGCHLFYFIFRAPAVHTRER